MAISTIGSFLMEGTGSGTLTWAKLVDIVDYPDLIPAPENLDATTLTDHMRVYIPGVKDSGGNIEFTANYTASDFNTLKGKEGVEGNYAVWFGESGTPLAPDGSAGKFTCKGYLYVAKKGGGVNEVSQMTVGIIPTTEITFAAS